MTATALCLQTSRVHPEPAKYPGHSLWTLPSPLGLAFPARAFISPISLPRAARPHIARRRRRPVLSLTQPLHSPGHTRRRPLAARALTFLRDQLSCVVNPRREEWARCQLRAFPDLTLSSVVHC